MSRSNSTNLNLQPEGNDAVLIKNLQMRIKKALSYHPMRSFIGDISLSCSHVLLLAVAEMKIMK